MRTTVLSVLLVPILTTIGAVPQRLKPQCRSKNVCDDRPQCPISSCNCLFPSGMDCAIYYQCINGKPFQYRCSPGLLFNEDTLSCDYSYNVNCSVGTTTSTTVTRTDPPVTTKRTEEPTSSTTTKKSTTTETPEEPTTTKATTKFPTTEEIITTKTTKGPTTSTKGTEKTTTVKTTEEPTTTKVTDEPHTSKITDVPITSETTVEPTTTKRPIPTVSTTYETAGKISTTTEEPFTTGTSEPSSSKTTEEPITANTTEGPTTIETVKPTSTETTSPDFTTSEVQTESTTINSSSDFECPTRFGLFPDPESCSRFYHCSQWIAYHKWCPPDLHFNPDLKVCDWPLRAGCAFGTTLIDYSTVATNTITEESTTTKIREESTTAKATKEPTTIKTTEKPTTTKVAEVSTVTETTNGPTTEELTSPKSTELTSSKTTVQPTSAETTEESSTVKTTKEPTTTKTTEPTTTKKTESTSAKTTENPTTTEEFVTTVTEAPPPTTMKTTKETSTTKTTEPITSKTEKPTTIETVSPTTVKITELTTTKTTELTTIKTTPEPATTKSTPELTTPQPTKEPTTTKTEKPTTTETAAPTTTKSTKEPITTKVTDESTTIKTTAMSTTEKPTTAETMKEPTTTRTTTKLPSTTKITETTTPTEILSTINPSSDFLCPTRFGLFPDPKSCFRFYHCSHWIPYHKWCPSNLHFNPKLKVCDWPYRAGCGTISPTTFKPDNPVTSNPNDTYGTCDCDCCELPVPGDCNAYTLCINKVAFIMHCSPDLYFNPMTGTCDYKENVVCAQEDFICPAQSGRYLLPGSCSYFVECHGGKKTIRKCPEGLQFNQSSEMCSWLGSCADQEPDGDGGSKIITDNAICNGCDYCFKPFEEDCSRYARCLRNTATEERCSTGLFFNADTEMCDHDYNVECPEPQPQPECPQTFGYFPYPGECGMYLKCVNGSATVKHCPGILHFDPVKKHCDYPWAAGCGDSDSLPTPAPTGGVIPCDCECCLKPEGTDCTSFVICINRIGYVRSCTSGLLFNPQTENCDFTENANCPITPEIPEYICPEHQGLFPHPDDCHKFIHCAHGIPYVKDCPSDLHFNPTLKVCDWPYSAGCQDYRPTDPPMDDNEFPCDVCDSCFIRNEADCAVYMYCQNGKGRRFRCAENLLFNPETESCDLATNVKCPNQPFSECLKPDGLFPASDCSQFIQCSNGIAYLKDCPNGLQFNPQQLVCDWPENVKCGEIPVLPTPSDEGSDTSNLTCSCDCCFLPYSKDCSKYILCLDGHVYIGQCSRGLLFNPEIQNCDFAERVTCGQHPPSCPEPNGLFPNEGQCSSYLKCSGGTAEVAYCRNGTHFSIDMEQCTDPCKAKCDSSYDCSSKPEGVTTSTSPSICLEPDGLYPVTNDCSSFYVCANGQPQRIKCPNELHYNPEYEVCEDPCDAQCDQKLECVSTSGISTKTTPSAISSSSTSDPQCLEGDGLFPSKDDCSSYYQCSRGRSYLMKCPQGLHFNYRRQSCDYPCEAKCNPLLDCSSPDPKTTPETSVLPSDPRCFRGDGLYPVKEDCSSFYQCSNGRVFDQKCQLGLHFSYKHEACEYPCVAKCDSSIDCATTTPKPTLSPHCPTSNGQYPVLGDCTVFYMCSNGKEYLIPCPPGLHYSETHEICENPCDAQCNASLDCMTTKPPLSSTTPRPISPECEKPDGLFPNPSDCGSFYDCSKGQSHLKYCPSGLHFSIDDSACEQPCVAGCDLNIDCPPEFPDTKGNCTCDNCFLPDPSDCSALYHCAKGKLTKGYCPYGKLFSRKSRTCVDERDADCEAKGDPSMCPDDFGFYPYPGDCTKFVHCDNGIAHIKQCKEGLEYDPQSRVCTKPKGYCGDPVQDPNCPEPTGLFPDSTNCSLFYHCEHGVAYHKRCSPPLLFNSEKEVCDWPKNVACGNDTTVSSTSSLSPLSSTLRPSSSPSPTPPSCHEVPGVICPCACRVPSYEECSSYFQCQEDGTACKRFCPEGLYFNKVEMVCDIPENVKCRDFFYTSLRRAKHLGHLSSFSPTSFLKIE